ncbi:TIGR04438 family Trp-rich protein [Aquincola sp. S2]|uniref:TIGR04438 family Trp-rich protein n=1 Tax=Pseudaquabacterium terrae TaxID=2732868 RepID=A0ABX2EMZ1_9BURK|nr:TIGR04438 family Trp-rich protein [Aquabacterium terrae]NRF69995.1 TIGR04438 family Trp-rich protein [Aquabacterium terrae]
MWFVAVGCLLVLLKWADLTPVANWGWLWVLSPFAAAAVWWIIADATGFTKQRESDKEQRRVEARRERHLDNMGLNLKKRRGGTTGKPRVPTDDNPR